MAWQDRSSASGPGEREVVRLVSAMRLARRKRPMALLRLALAVRERLPESTGLHLTVLGAGPQRPVMRAFIRRHGMTPWVTLAGRLDHVQMRGDVPQQ